MRYYTGLLLLLTLNTTLTAQAQDFYTELDFLHFASPGDFDSEQTLGFTFGYQINDNHALETEVQINGLDSTEPGFEVDADLITYLLGYRYTSAPSNSRQWFAGLGAGYSRPEFYISSDEQAKDDVWIQFGRLGMTYQLTENAYLSGELRYQHISDLSKNGVSFNIGSIPVIGLSAGYQF